jgi:hypothetical protein
MMRTLSAKLFAATVLATGAAAADAAADCTCRAGGRDYGLGRSACLSTPTGFRLATCDMVLNNTSWKISATPCVEATAPGPGEERPARHATHRHRHGG